MAWDDQRDRISAQRLPYGLSGAGLADSRRDFTIGSRRAWRNSAGELIDIAGEVDDVGEVERDVEERIQLPGQMFLGAAR